MSTLLKELLDEISIIDQSYKDTVNGYVRNMQQEFEIIPSIIFHLILAFFCKPDEYFGKAGQNVILSNNNRTVERKGKYSWNNTTYGHQWISSTTDVIVKWEFEINYNNLINTGLAFSIVSKDNRCNHCRQKEDVPWYEYNIAGTLSRNDESQPAVNPCRCAAGDRIVIILDLIKKSISIIDKPKDGKETTQLLFEEVEAREDINYKIAVLMIEPKTKITLKSVSYSQ